MTQEEEDQRKYMQQDIILFWPCSMRAYATTEYRADVYAHTYNLMYRQTHDQAGRQAGRQTDQLTD